VPALKVRFVIVPKSIAAPLKLKVTVLLPRLIVRTLLLFDTSAVAVTLKLDVVNEPLVTVMLPELVSASPSVSVMPTPLTIIAPMVLPAVVSVPVAAKVITLVLV